MRERRRAAGFTLIEVAVAAVLVAVLAAATVPTLSEFMANRDAATTAATLSQVGAGIAAFHSAVRTGSPVTSSYPQFISSLTNTITTTGTAASRWNSCHGPFNAAAVAKWEATAPFVTFNIPVGGLYTPLGVIQDSMVRSPATAAVGTLSIRMTVDSVDAVRLDRVIDGGDGGGAGTLRMMFNGAGTSARTADIQYLVPVAAAC